MSKKTFIIIATAIFVLQSGIMGWMIIKREITLSKGDQYCFRTAPVDPHDVFRGKYVRVDIDGDGPFTNKTEFNRGQKLYAPIMVDTNGIASLAFPSIEPPEDKPYMKVECYRSYEQRVKNGIKTTLMYYCKQKKGGSWRWRNSDYIEKNNLEYTKVRTNTVDQYKYTGKYISSIKVPFDRYYMDENLAPGAEQAYWESSIRGQRDAILKVRVHHGYALIEALEVGGTPIRDLVIQEK